MKDELPDLAKLQVDLTDALAEYEEARHEAKSASRLEDSSREKVNGAQDALDEAMEKIRQGADRNTRWGRQGGARMAS